MTTTITEEQRVAASFTVAMMRRNHSAAGRAETAARNDLAAAILDLDAKRDLIEAAIERGDNPRPHDLNEQVAVVTALKAYGNALADLVRGEDPHDD